MIYRFDAFELDEARYELRQDGELRSLPCKSFDVLRLLLEHAGRVVTKQEIFERVWKGERVGAAVLPVHVRTIRRALGPRAASAILHTARGRGYVIACRVERAEGSRLAARPLQRVPRRGDALAALSQVNGMLALALVLGDLGLAGDSLDLLVSRASRVR